jgi:hypothetical protein
MESRKAMGIAHAARGVVPASAALAAAWGSLALGTAGLVLVATAPTPLVAVLAGTAGIAGAAVGLALLRARAAEAPVPVAGIAAGALAALLLVAQLGVSILDRPAAARPTTAPTAVPTRAALAGAVNSLAYLLTLGRSSDGAWPAGLAVTDDGRVYATSGPSVGHVLLRTPAGTTVTYAVSPDRSRCTLVMRATADPGVAVRFSSTTGLSTND